MTDHMFNKMEAPALTAEGPLEDIQRRAEAIVNPASGLANDYLNLFNEIVMLIEQLPAMPELIEDILKWRPVTYQSYFAKSILPGRVSALEAYEKLDLTFRKDFESVVADLDRRAVGAVVAIRRQYKKQPDTSSPLMSELCERVGQALREILLTASDLVNHGRRSQRESEQERADRLIYGTVRRVG
ncbi:MAG: hypothetical protein P4L68_11370 [Methylovirgula sp.]|nr:hypothetical protein [Methylovirgula sp.]